MMINPSTSFSVLFLNGAIISFYLLVIILFAALYVAAICYSLKSVTTIVMFLLNNFSRKQSLKLYAAPLDFCSCLLHTGFIITFADRR